MAKLLLKWTKGNSKLNKLKTIGFGLPAISACPQANTCKSICYATQGTYRFKAVRAAREYNFIYAKLVYFDDILIKDLASIKESIVRIHDSGDFFNQRYFNAWLLAAKTYPDKIFYAYTKSLNLIKWGELPSNFRIVQSEGGKLDHLINKTLPHAKIFTNHDFRIAAKYDDGNIDDSHAINGSVKIGLVYHGGKNLTDQQAKFYV